MKFRSTLSYLLIFTFLLSVTFLAHSNPNRSFDEGLAAYKKGDYKQALEILRPIAEQGNAVGQLVIGLMYADSLGVEKNDSEAVEWYRKAAEQGNAAAQFALGWMYANGRGVEKNDSEAVEWYRKAAEQGMKDARIQLNRLNPELCQQNSEIQLFGEALICTNREKLRTAIKNSGGKVKEEDSNHWGDTYFSSGLIKDSSELYVSYSVDSSQFVLARYTFPSRMDSEQVVRIKNMIESKYNKPDYSNGNPNLGDVSYVWNLPDGIELGVVRGWPNTTTYLVYKHKENYEAQQREMQRQKQAREAESFRSQKNNF